MKYTTVLSLATLAFCVTAAPSNVERDLPTVTSILSSVGSGLSSLDTIVKAFSGPSDPITSSSSTLIATINAGTTTVSGSDDLSLTDALGLEAPVKDLQTFGASLATDLIAKKSAFESAGLCDTISKESTLIQTASGNLISAIIAKVPSSASSIAQSLVAPLQADLASAVAAFAPGNCTNAAGTGSSSASSSSAASSTAPSSSKAASSSSVAKSTSSSLAVHSTTSASKISATGAAAPTGSISPATSVGTVSSVGPTSSTVPFTGAAANNAVSFSSILAAAAAALML